MSINALVLNPAEPSLTWRSLETGLLVFHSVTILACIWACHRYVYKTFGLPRFLRRWVACLSIVLLLYVGRLATLDMEATLFFAGIEGLVSNVANVFLMLMAYEIRNRPPLSFRDEPMRCSLLGGATLAPLVVAYLLGVQSIGWQNASSADVDRLARLLVHLPSAFFSMYALIRVARALRLRLVSLKAAVSSVFSFYAVYQLGYLFIPAAGYVAGSDLRVFETAFMSGSFVFKLACTALLIAGASEIAKQRELRLLRRVEEFFARGRVVGGKAGRASEPAPFGREFERRVMVFADEPETDKLVRTVLGRSGFRTVSPPRAAGDMSGELQSCKYGIVVWDRTPSDQHFRVARAIVSERKDCLYLWNKKLPTPESAQQWAELTKEFETHEDLEAKLAKWARSLPKVPVGAKEEQELTGAL